MKVSGVVQTLYRMSRARGRLAGLSEHHGRLVHEMSSCGQCITHSASALPKPTTRRVIVSVDDKEPRRCTLAAQTLVAHPDEA